MSIGVTILVLVAAALHAGWNALIKTKGDRIQVMAMIALSGSLFSLPGPDDLGGCNNYHLAASTNYDNT